VSTEVFRRFRASSPVNIGLAFYKSPLKSLYIHHSQYLCFDRTVLLFNSVFPNVVVEWLTLLFHIQEVPVQTSARRLAEICRGFPQSLQANTRIVP
jgi:hypothetical protein